MDIVINQAGMERIKSACRRWQFKITEEVLKDAKRFAPYRYGLLKNSIYRVENKVYVLGQYSSATKLGVGAYYWFYQEYGTRKMKAQPFMRPALFKRR